MCWMLAPGDKYRLATLFLAAKESTFQWGTEDKVCEGLKTR